MLFRTALSGLMASVAMGASLTPVNYPNNATSKVAMHVKSENLPLQYQTDIPSHRYIYVPDAVIDNPPLVVVLHSCQSSAQSYFQNSKVPWKAGSDNKGYITVWPSSPHPGTCWDVSSKGTLTHNGGGDSQAISNMILYAIEEYKVDASRVFVTGGSSGGMSDPLHRRTHALEARCPV